MAKSLRSKWRRKCRAVKRVRYGEKELERLKKVVGNDPCYKADIDMTEVTKIAKVVNKTTIQRRSRKPNTQSTATANPDEAVEEMETNTKRTFNPKTMKDQHGTYPVWMHPRKIHKRKKVGKGKLKKKQNRKATNSV